MGWALAPGMKVKFRKAPEGLYSKTLEDFSGGSMERCPSRVAEAVVSSGDLNSIWKTAVFI